MACLGVPLLGTLQGIALSIGVSLLALLARSTQPRISVLGRKPGTDVFRPNSPEHPEDETFPGLLLVRGEAAVGEVQAGAFCIEPGDPPGCCSFVPLRIAAVQQAEVEGGRASAADALPAASTVIPWITPRWTPANPFSPSPARVDSGAIPLIAGGSVRLRDRNCVASAQPGHRVRSMDPARARSGAALERFLRRQSAA